MPRKTRKKITFETYKTVQSLLSNDNIKIKDISAIVDLSRRSVTNIIKNLESGKFPTFSERLKQSEEGFKQKKSVKTVDVVMKNFISCNNDVTLEEIKNELSEKLGKSLSLSTICRKLKTLGITRKRLSLIPEERNSKEKIDLRAVYAAEISKYNVSNLVFLDETGFNLHTARHYGYSMKNLKAYKQVPANKAKNVSCLCVISYDGLVSYEVKKSSYNSSLFIEFIEAHLVKYFKSYPEKVLIMDNAKFHHSKDVLNKLRKNRIPVLFLPPYSPQLNPIEEFFSMIKARFSSKKSSNTVLENKICDILKEDLQEDCRSFYKNMEVWLEKARQKKEFI